MIRVTNKSMLEGLRHYCEDYLEKANVIIPGRVNKSHICVPYVAFIDAMHDTCYILLLDSVEIYVDDEWVYYKEFMDDTVGYATGDNTCICCGAVIPEGRQVCPQCEQEIREKGLNYL